MALNAITSLDKESNRNLNTGNSAVSGQPVRVSELIGTCVTDEDADGYTVVDIGEDAIYEHPVRNVRTYNASSGAEATWGAIAEGDYIYIDNVSALPAGCYLSTSPLNDIGGANKLFGKAVTADATATAKTATIEVKHVQV